MNLFEGTSLQLKVLRPGPSPPSACWLRSRKQEAMQLSQDQLLEPSLTRPEKDKPVAGESGNSGQEWGKPSLKGSEGLGT